jgi:hypothetical protein
VGFLPNAAVAAEWGWFGDLDATDPAARQSASVACVKIQPACAQMCD